MSFAPGAAAGRQPHADRALAAEVERFLHIIRVRGSTFRLFHVSSVLNAHGPLARFSWVTLQFAGRDARLLPHALEAVADRRPGSCIVLDWRRLAVSQRPQITGRPPGVPPDHPLTAVVVDAVPDGPAAATLRVCLIRDSQRLPSNDSGAFPPAHEELLQFHQVCRAHYVPQLEGIEPLRPLLVFMLPHQLRNALAMTAKEQLAISAYEMLKHFRLRSATSHRLSDLVDVPRRASKSRLANLPIDTGRDMWLPGVRVVTMINDEVGTGKTLSALSVLALNGPRAENPWGLDPPLRDRTLMPWVNYHAFREDDAWPDRRCLDHVADMSTGDLPRIPDPEPAEPGYAQEAPLLSRNAQNGGTLLVVPHNVVDHWAAELARVEAMARPLAPWRVGIVGKGKLARTQRISPERLAADYDVVLLPHTLMRFPADMDHPPRTLVPTFVPGFNWPEPRAQHVQYMALCADPLDDRNAYVVHMSLAFLEARAQRDGNVWTLRVGPEDFISPHSVVYRSLPSAPFALSGTHARDQAFPARRFEWAVMTNFLSREKRTRLMRITHTLVAAPTAPTDGWAAATQAGCLYAGAHDEDVAALMTATKAILHVRWARLVLDELHLLALSGTQRFRYMSMLQADNVIGLTAEPRGGNAAVETRWALTPVHAALSSDNHRLGIPLATSAIAANRMCCPAMRHSEVVVQPLVFADLPTEVVAAERGMWETVGNALRSADARGQLVRIHDVMIGDFSALGAVLRTVLRHTAFAAPGAGGQDAAISALAAAGENARAAVDAAREHMIATQQRMNAAGSAARAQAPRPEMAAAVIVRAEELAGDDPRLICPICFEEDTREEMQVPWVAMCPCLHAICEDCFDGMREHRTAGRTCSMCRRRISAYARVLRPEPEQQAGDEGASSGPSEGAPEMGAGAGSGSGSAGDEHGDISGAEAEAAAAAEGSQSKRMVLHRLLVRLLRSEEGFPAMNGAVIFCDCRDEQMRALQAWLQGGLGGAADVRCILSCHTAQQRARITQSVEAQVAARPQVLIVRFRMCAVGVNYIFADNVIFYTTPHRADFVHQAVGRICRLGQTRERVRAWMIAYSDTFEEEVWSAWMRRATQVGAEAARLIQSPTLAAICARYWDARVGRLPS